MVAALVTWRAQTARSIALAALSAGVAACQGDPWGASPNADPGPPVASQEERPRATAPANGFGDEIAWRSLSEGLALAADQSRPLMLVVHASWCKSCKALKPAFHGDEIERLSRELVMVNIDQDQEPRSSTFAVDGTYVPRIFFLDPKTGQPDPGLRNERRDRFHFFYTPQDDLAGVMKEAIDRYERS